jgi:hypothetical protein
MLLKKNYMRVNAVKTKTEKALKYLTYRLKEYSLSMMHLLKANEDRKACAIRIADLVISR